MNMVGYTERRNTYRLWNPATSQIVTSCDVSFLDAFEPALPNAKLASPAPPTSDEDSAVSIFFRDLEHSIGIEQEGAHNPNLTEPTPNTDAGIQTADCELDPASASSDDDTFQSATVTTSTPKGNQHHPDAPQQENDHAPANAPTKPKRNKSRLNYNNLAKGVLDLSHLGHLALVAKNTDNSKASAMYHEAMTRSDSEQWVTSMKKELDAMSKSQVFELVDPPEQANIVGSKWVYKWKVNPDGTLTPKSRLVAQGFTQTYGLDYTSTFAPVVAIEVVRLLFAFACLRSWHILQFDGVSPRQPQGDNLHEATGRLCRRE